MRMSILPNSSLTFLNTSRIWSRLVTSILIASDRRPILRISSAVLLECTQPCDTATCASMLPWSSAVFCRSGSSSTSTSVMTTSAPWRASVRASWRPSPRDAPVTTATFPVRSNMFSPLVLPIPPSPFRPAASRRATFPLRGKALSDLDCAARSGDRAGDHQPLDLCRALPDLIDLRVAKPLLHRVLLDVPVAAQHLDGIGRHLHRDIAGEAFRHRPFGSPERHALGGHPA